MTFQREFLGHRERDVMNAIWALGAGTVHDISRGLNAKLAYTTVQTTIDRLYRKGLLVRRKKGLSKAFIYAAKMSPQEVENRRAAEFVRRFFSGSNEHPDVLISCFVDAVRHYDQELLSQLEAKILAAKSKI